MDGDTSINQITSGSEMPVTTIAENKLEPQITGLSKHSKGFNSAFDDMYIEAFKAPNLGTAHNEYVPVGQSPMNEMRVLNHGKRETAGNRLLNAFVRQIKGVDFLGDAPNLKFPIKNADTPQNFSMDCQILKSAGNWSLGLKDEMTENSIHLAYIELIKNAQHFIYIENQFFISGHGDPIVSNQITNALYSKIKDKIQKVEKFKVIILLPLRPGFEGEFDAKESSTVKICMSWHQSTINKDKGSLLKR
jgi:phosphatidylserine/phosphatidylglycerophosphate/cardiolipin synthase-like enzyme